MWNPYFSVGLSTQRNPLRPGNESALTNRFYGSKGDSLLDGLNVEISNRLTMVRRPGSSVYNSQIFPAIDNFYQFRTFNSNVENIQVIADTSSIIYDATGPSTKTTLFTKSAGAGEAYFQSVGNTLYIGDGADQVQYIQGADVWTPSTLYDQGSIIVDPNGNIQVAVGSLTFSANWVIGRGSPFSLLFDPTDPGILPIARFLINVNFTFSNFVIATALNGKTESVSSVSGANQSPVPDFSFTTVELNFSSGGTGVIGGQDSGTATTGNGISGSTIPTWSTGVGQVTVDGGAQWINHGKALVNWGIAAPTIAPSVAQLPIGTNDTSWAASLYYPSAGGFVSGPYPDQNGYASPILESGIIQFISRLVVPANPAVTGASIPTFSGTPGSSVNDGNITWTCQGTAAPGTGRPYAQGQWINVTASDGNAYFFRCVIPGTSGSTAPTSWTPAYGLQVIDGAVTWENVGPSFDWNRIGPNQLVAVPSEVLDSNGDRQTTVISGVSGTTAPTWATTQGALTTDGTVTWLNDGPLSPASTLSWVWAYAYKNSVTGNVSNASPVSIPLLQLLNNYVQIQGPRSTDSQIDTVVIYRSVQGGSTATLLYEDEIPNPASGLWAYYDNSIDLDLNNLILANVALSASPPPTGVTKMTYHLGRIWGVVNNAVYFSAGPDSTNGNGNEQFPPANVFVFPDQVNRLYASSQGLFVFTVSDVYLIQGTTTTSFFSVPFLTGLGLQNYNAWDVNGSTVYMFSSDYQVVSLDLGTGVSEVGFPIGDQFLKMSTAGFTTSIFDASIVRVSWHISGSPDKGLYVSDFANGWFRLYPTPSPETGLTWAPFANIVGGVSTVQSIETSPGTHSLLIGPKTSGPILKRDDSVYTDNGVAYDANFLIGSIVVAQPGQLAEMLFLTTDSIATGTRPTISIQLDEIAPFSAGMFEALSTYVPDPPQLTPSVSMYSDRHYLSVTQQPALGRNLQINFDWGTDTVQNELLSLTLFGGFQTEL